MSTPWKRPTYESSPGGVTEAIRGVRQIRGEAKESAPTGGRCGRVTRCGDEAAPGIDLARLD
jgi:hypothetical protein